jgi:hypothetical protein
MARPRPVPPVSRWRDGNPEARVAVQARGLHRGRHELREINVGKLQPQLARFREGEFL